MSEAALIRGRCGRAVFVALLVLLGSACAPGGASPRADGRATTTVPPIVTAHRTVVERTAGAVAGVEVVLRTVVVRSGDRAIASMEAIAPGTGRPTLIAEEIRIGDDHFVHLPAAVHVLGYDVWIHFDLTDDRHVRFLEEHAIGLFAEADRSGDTAGSGVRVRRDDVTPAPDIVRPPAARTVPFQDLDELPGPVLPLPR